MLTKNDVGFMSGEFGRADEAPGLVVQIHVHRNEVGVVETFSEPDALRDAGIRGKIASQVHELDADLRRKRPGRTSRPIRPNPTRSSSLCARSAPKAAEPSRHLPAVTAFIAPKRRLASIVMSAMVKSATASLNTGAMVTATDRSRGVDVYVIEADAHRADHPQARRPRDHLLVHLHAGAHEETFCVGHRGTKRVPVDRPPGMKVRSCPENVEKFSCKRYRDHHLATVGPGHDDALPRFTGP